MSELLQKLNWRYATKEFDPEFKLTAEQIGVLQESIRLTPSSFGLQPWHFFWIENPEIKSKIRAVSWNQGQVEDCAALVVMCAKTNIGSQTVEDYMQCIAKTRQVDRSSLDGFASMLNSSLESKSEAEVLTWAKKQVYIALGQLMETAVMLDLDTCPMEGFEPDKLDVILNLQEKGLTSVVLCPVGKRSSTDKYAQLQKVRFPLEAILTKI